MPQPDLSIIIVSWNTRALLADCLASIYSTSGDLNGQVIVVDNASRDDSAAMVRGKFPRARLIENRENVGFARANNQAIEASTGQFVLLLNSDTIVQPHALARLVAFMREHPDAGIVGANVRNRDGSPQRSFGAFPSILSESIQAWGLDTRPPFARWFNAAHCAAEYFETGWVLGAALLIRRQAIVQVGLLDENFFMYSEEVDWCYRVARAGWKNFVLTTAPIIHLGNASARQMPAQMKAELFRSKAHYFRKHYGALTAYCLRAIFSASILAKRWTYGLVGKKTQSALWAETWTHFVRATS